MQLFRNAQYFQELEAYTLIEMCRHNYIWFQILNPMR